jgi:inward rectifier potassium channel
MKQSPIDDSAFGAGPRSDSPLAGRFDPANQDLGFGSVVARDSRERLLNRDGTFNVHRKGLGLLRSQSGYHALLSMSWPRFLLLFAAVYVATNAVFALAYAALPVESLPGLENEGISSRLEACFFFSVHTLATIGYGHVIPRGVGANVLVLLESLVGLLAFALAAGLMFARFSHPDARILFSDVAVIAPHRDGKAFMFRIVNARENQLVELDAKVVLTRRRPNGGREFHQLSLERERVTFFPLAWTVVHRIDAESPLRDTDASSMAEQEVEFLILLSGFDETFSQTVHARSSYRFDEVQCGRRFANMFDVTDGKGIAVDVEKLSETTAV